MINHKRNVQGLLVDWDEFVSSRLVLSLKAVEEMIDSWSAAQQTAVARTGRANIYLISKETSVPGNSARWAGWTCATCSQTSHPLYPLCLQQFSPFSM